MPPKIRQLKARLRKAGAYQIAQEGSHTKWKHSLIPTETLLLAGNDGKDAKRYQERDVQDFLHQIEIARRSL